jgi:hypothetical protein
VRRERDDGDLAQLGVALIRRVASQPSITGRLMSIKMRSGLSLVAIATPRAPSSAMVTS